MTRCSCVGARHTCGIQNVNPATVYVGQGGPKGAQGTQGVQGRQGLQGTQGVGTQGAQGTAGSGGLTLQQIQDAINASALDTTDDLAEGATNKYFTVGRVSYIHTQGVSSSTWVINHNLGFNPNLTVQDSAGTIYEGEITYTNLVSLTVTFSSAFSGKAYLS